MQVTWLTQAGLLFENERITIMVDPYLSDSVGMTLDEAKHRRIPVKEEYLSVHPDVLIITHNHLDHLDPDTLKYILDTDKQITVIAPYNAYEKLRTFGRGHNYVLLDPHSVWSERNVTFYAVKAAHSDRTAAGYIIDDGSKTYYITGDTLYNYDTIDDVLDLVEDGVDYVFLPINGVGNNMNAKDATDFAYEINARYAIPLHYGLFDDIEPTDAFDFEDAIILMPYQKTNL